ncbi:MAG: Coenzyme F420 hydrogenase/dehydrogenase, beta subunit C-terminal domain [Bacteroidales bacterium]|nr:Coenzyme F420 hydrogenase/dehydrogenase, beta subunit C-terminal domain [Bacteroidales bacterium]
MKSIDKLEKVMHSELCNRCGSCVGLSGGKIVFRDREGKYLPERVGDIDDSLAERMWAACSGKEFNFPEYRNHFYNDAPNVHEYTGAYRNIYIGHANDNEIRRNAASGGIISAIVIYLLENKKIDGVVTLRMSHKKPWLSEPFIATSREEVLEAAQSKYTISSVNEILPEIERFDGKLAYVGIPPQVQSIRKLQKINDPSVRNIKYIFGPFYGNTLYFSSIKSFLRSYKEKDYTKIKKLYFRYGEWPGSMRIELDSGKTIELKKFHANYLNPFHVLKNSLYCTDFTNEYTDISGGDAWAPVYEERGKGFSMIIARSKNGQEIIDEMVRSGALYVDPLSEEEAIKMHSHGYDFKKRGSFIRIKFRKLAGKQVPDYGYKLSGFGGSRYFMEMLISFLFMILRTGFARWAVKQLPPGVVGAFFEKARTFWKKSTHKVKRKNLTE